MTIWFQKCIFIRFNAIFVKPQYLLPIISLEFLKNSSRL